MDTIKSIDGEHEYIKRVYIPTVRKNKRTKVEVAEHSHEVVKEEKILDEPISCDDNIASMDLNSGNIFKNKKIPEGIKEKSPVRIDFKKPDKVTLDYINMEE